MTYSLSALKEIYIVEYIVDLGFRVQGLNSLKGGYIRDYIEEYYRASEGDTRSAGYSSF